MLEKLVIKSLSLLQPLEEALLQVDGWLGRAVTNALLHNFITCLQFGAHHYCSSVQIVNLVHNFITRVQFGAHSYCSGVQIVPLVHSFITRVQFGAHLCCSGVQLLSYCVILPCTRSSHFGNQLNASGTKLSSMLLQNDLFCFAAHTDPSLVHNFFAVTFVLSSRFTASLSALFM